MESELNTYIRILKNRFLPIILVGVLFALAGLGFRYVLPPVYQASLLVSIGGYLDVPEPEFQQVRVGLELANTYAQLASTKEVIEATIVAKNLPAELANRADLVSARVIPNTSLVEINVRHSDPVLAANIANGVAEQLLIKSPTNLTPEEQSLIDLARSQIEILTRQIEDTREELAFVDRQFEAATTRDLAARLTLQRNQIIDRINQSSSTVAEFSKMIVNLQARSNSLNIVQPAQVPTSPTGPHSLILALAGGIIGLAVAISVVLLVEYLNDSIQTPNQIRRFLDLPFLGAINRTNQPLVASLRKGERQKKADQKENSKVFDQYRMLRTNILYAGEHHARIVYIITSPNPHEGKSVVATNLAAMIALDGLKVLLVDADLRKPGLHSAFGLTKAPNPGLSQLLAWIRHNRIKMGPDAKLELPPHIESFVKESPIPNLKIIFGGSIPDNPTELLGSAETRGWVSALQSALDVDVVIIDTPPCLEFADSTVLAATTQAGVLFVVEANRTRLNAVMRAKEQVMNTGSRIAGVILNKTRAGDVSEYGYSELSTDEVNRWRQALLRGNSRQITNQPHVG